MIIENYFRYPSFRLRLLICVIHGDFFNVYFFTLHNEMYQHLEGLYHSVSQYFPNDQFMVLQNLVWVKKSIQNARKKQQISLNRVPTFH